MSGWKAHQADSKAKKKTKLALIVLAFLAALLICYKLIVFVKFLGSPLGDQYKKQSAWDGQFNLNLVMMTRPISVISYNPEEKTVTALTIPDETYIDVPEGFGKWQVSSIDGLGRSSHLSGKKLLEQSLADFLGIPIDGFISINLIDEFRGNFFSGLSVLGKIQTDLTPLELMRFKIGIMGVRFDKINKIDLVGSGILEKQELADSTRVYIADPIRMDSVLTDFQDSKIRSEHLSISIFNASDKPLLAQKAKRLITNLGGNVVVTQNAPRTIAKSYVQGQNSKTLERLSQIFSPDCSVDRKVLAVSERSESNCDKIPLGELGSASSRAQIIVVLGEDFP